MPRALVIIPTYNEIENIELLLRAVFSLSQPFHVLVVDDSSPDGTAERVKSLQREYDGALHLLVRDKKNGLGRAYVAGFHWALEKGYDYFFEMDADFSHDPNDLPRLYEAVREGRCDMAVGSRYVKGVNVVNWPMGRVLMSWLASKYVRLVTWMPISDTTAGFVCFRREVIEKIGVDNIRFVGYAFQIEMKYKTYRNKFKIKEIPVIFTDRIRGKSKLDGRIFWEAFFGVIRMRFRRH